MSEGKHRGCFLREGAEGGLGWAAGCVQRLLPSGLRGMLLNERGSAVEDAGIDVVMLEIIGDAFLEITLREVVFVEKRLVGFDNLRFHLFEIVATLDGIIGFEHVGLGKELRHSGFVHHSFGSGMVHTSSGQQEREEERDKLLHTDIKSGSNRDRTSDLLLVRQAL